jgi:hypothetical protein
MSLLFTAGNQEVQGLCGASGMMFIPTLTEIYKLVQKSFGRHWGTDFTTRYCCQCDDTFKHEIKNRAKNILLAFPRHHMQWSYRHDSISRASFVKTTFNTWKWRWNWGNSDFVLSSALESARMQVLGYVESDGYEFWGWRDEQKCPVTL